MKQFLAWLRAREHEYFTWPLRPFFAPWYMAIGLIKALEIGANFTPIEWGIIATCQAVGGEIMAMGFWLVFKIVFDDEGKDNACTKAGHGNQEANETP